MEVQSTTSGSLFAYPIRLSRSKFHKTFSGVTFVKIKRINFTSNFVQVTAEFFVKWQMILLWIYLQFSIDTSTTGKRCDLHQDNDLTQFYAINLTKSQSYD